ncbi:MAG: hypothetical protein Roseis2KO_53140 [Roseivirga sp.]
MIPDILKTKHEWQFAVCRWLKITDIRIKSILEINLLLLSPGRDFYQISKTASALKGDSKIIPSGKNKGRFETNSPT